MGEQVRVQATSAGYVQPGTATIRARLQRSSGRDWGQEPQLKSSSLMKERVEVPAEIWRRAGLGRLC